MAVPIDRGWAWVVVTGAFMNLVFLIGIGKCFGIIFAELLELYHGSASSTSSMLAISAGLSLFLAPLVTTLSDVYTCRKVAMVGGVLCSLGFLVPAFCNSLEQIVLSFGILTGLGYGICLTPSAVIVGRYFDRFRSLANGLMFSGSGVGGMVIPLVFYYIIELFGLNGAFVILAAIALQSVVFSALYRPLEYWTRIGCSSDGRTTRSTTGEEEETEGDEEKRTTDDDKANDCGGGGVPSDPNPQQNGLTFAAEEGQQSPAGAAAATVNRRHYHRPSLENTNHQEKQEQREDGGDLSPHASNPNISSATANYLTVPSPHPHHRSGQRQKSSRAASNASLYFSAMNLAAWPSIPEIRHVAAVSSYRRDNFTQTEENINSKNRRNCCDNIGSIFRRACWVKAADGSELPLFDIRLLKHPPFLLFIIACTFVLASVYITMIVPPHCLELGMTKTQISLLLSVQGGADTVGRLAAGFLGDRSFVKSRRKCLVTMACLICSLSTYASIFLTSFWTLLAYLVVVSVAMGSFIATIPVMLVELVGVENLSRAWGLTAFLEGFSVTLTPLIIGALRDWTSSYYSGLIFLATCFALATICVSIVAFMEYRSNRSTSRGRTLLNPAVNVQ